jgi:hypothetical protein
LTLLLDHHHSATQGHSLLHHRFWEMAGNSALRVPRIVRLSWGEQLKADAAHERLQQTPM